LAKANAPKEALVVYHPQSGTAGDIDRRLGMIVRRLCEESKYVVSIRPLKPNMTGEEMFSSNSADYDLIIAAGGDGTIRAVLGAAASVGCKTPIGLIPFGTGNLLARSLGIFHNDKSRVLEHALDIILNGEPASLDLGEMNGHFFCIDAGFGPISNAIVVPKAKDKAKLSFFAYVSPLLRSLAHRPHHFRITADGEVFEVTASGLFVTNAREMGIGSKPGIRQLSTGVLNLCIMNPVTALDYMRILKRFGAWFLTGQADDRPPYTVREVRQLHIETVQRERPRSFLERTASAVHRLVSRHPRPAVRGQVSAMVDGDRCCVTPVDVSIVPGAVNVMVPCCESPPNTGETIETVDQNKLKASAA